MGSEREKFEAWFVGKYGHDMFVESDWEAWQAAKAEAVPDGYCVVPKEPTKEMLNAGYKVKHEKIIHLGNVYKAMIESQEKESGC